MRTSWAIAGAVVVVSAHAIAGEPPPDLSLLATKVQFDAEDPLAPKLKLAFSEALIAEDARSYMLARWRLRTQGAQAALRDLDVYRTRLFPDRAALLRGQAFEARKNFEGAKRCYLEALDTSAAPGVTQAAIRGLISLTGKTDDWKGQLEYLDREIEASEQPEPALALSRAGALLELGRKDEASAQVWEILEAYPDPKTVEKAQKLLAQIEDHRPTKAEKARMDLARARHWMRAGRSSRALSALSEAKSSAPERAAEIEIEMARVYRLRKSRQTAEEILQRLASRTDLGAERGDVLLELGRLAADRFQYQRARYIFQEVNTELPGTAAAATAAYEAAQVEYDEEDYAVAARKMAAIENGVASPELARNALWMAGWSAYLAETASVAITNFERLRNSDPDPELRDRATYWLARTYEKQEHWQAAIDAYREVALRSPFRYYGLWSRAHLKTLHVPWMLVPPAKYPAPETVEDVVKLLGKERPINVDRAIALYRQNMVPEEVEELLAAMIYYRSTRNRLGLTLVIDLMHLFNRDKWASLVARNIADESPEQPSGEDFFWRIWRYAYPTPYEPEVERASNDHSVDPFLTYAVMRTESRFRPDVVSAVGARGLMQLMPATARWIARVTPDARREAAKYRAPGPNIWLGSWYLRNLVDRFSGNAAQVLGAYNAGPDAMERWVWRFGDLALDEFAERIPYTETRIYVRRCLESYMIYHALYDPQPKDELEAHDG
jgi:peptidoglycan lytic transglycosylase